MDNSIEKKVSKNCIVSKEFLPELKKLNIWLEQDYRLIAKVNGSSVSHIKNVIEKQHTTNQVIFDTILEFYALRKLNKEKENNSING